MARPDDRAIDSDSLRRRLTAFVAAVEPGLAHELAPDEVRIVRAPGRVNLIGEHTDYNGGLVLPIAVDLEIRIAFAPTLAPRVMLQSGEDPPWAFDLEAPGPRRGAWIDYVAGTAWALAQAGVPMHGLVGVIGASLPREAGLSSSAALELASAWSLAGDAMLSEAPLDVARICQRAENDYVGVQCGLMDQFAVAAGRAGAATLLDCRTLEHRPVPLPSDLALVVCHTGSVRRLGASDYNHRRVECERAVAALARESPGLTALRDVMPDDLGWAATILDDAAFRRCRHVVTENARVLETIAAFEAGDEAPLGPIFAASHASLRDDYEVSSPELDLLVDVATTTPGVIASRMTGGGFGGCTVVLVRPGTEDRLATEVARRYDAATGLRARVIPVRAVDGAGYVSPSGRLPAA